MQGGPAQGAKDGAAGLPGGVGGGPGAGGGGGAGAQAAAASGGRKIYECYLEGAISADRHEALLDRLLGLCGPAGAGRGDPLSTSATSSSSQIMLDEDDTYVAPPVVLHHRELLFKAPPPPASMITTQTQTVGAAAAAALGVPTNPAPSFNELRVRCRLVPSKQGPAPSASGAWSVHYNSVPLMREKMAANVRNVTDVEVSDNIIDFLRLMGYQFQFEFIREGFVFQTQRKITVSVTQIKKIVDREDLSTAEPLVAGTWFVELSARTDDSNLIPSVADEINSFADYLMPLVDVKRVDYRRFFATSLAADTLPQAKRPPAGPPQLGRAKAPAGGFPPAGAGRGGQPPPPGQQTTKTTTSSNAPTSWITL